MCALTNVPNPDEILIPLLKDGFNKVIERYVQHYIDEAKQRLQETVPEIASAVAIHVWKNASLERFGHELVIKIDMQGGDRNEKL